ncbi:PAQR family membrane homeostasis protein TrhA [Zongyangia hominis]|uniref:PAQR family membrane homeostasis protein TrhA n=1 Tax=Zongyangia hominis TaxID=2763677 RepID=UPI0021CC605F|nr:hemolysin III family protein [Zongyangia hominis]
MSAQTHFYGALLSLIGTVALAAALLICGHPSPRKTVSVMIFGFTLVALYGCSSLYHFVKTTPERTLRLRKLDHAMIYVLIAGTYTPIFLCYLQGAKALWMTALIWAIGILGVGLMLLWFSMPRWLSTLLYLAMGWFLVYDLDALRAMQPGAIALLVIGGVFYTVGA